MIVYTVHEPRPHAQSIEERADNIVFVKEGFTWRGFLFGFLLAIPFAIVMRLLGLQGSAQGFVTLFLMFLLGFEWNDLRRWFLEQGNYTFLASVAGRDFEECERRFFDAWLPYASGQNIKPPSAPSSSSTPSATPWPQQSWGGSSAIGTLPGVNV